MGLLLELHALTRVARSYALLMAHTSTLPFYLLQSIVHDTFDVLFQVVQFSLETPSPWYRCSCETPHLLLVATCTRRHCKFG